MFVWVALKGKISDRFNLRRRGILPEGASELCPLCREVDETMDHLLCRCQFIGDVWCLFLNLFGC